MRLFQTSQVLVLRGAVVRHSDADVSVVQLGPETDLPGYVRECRDIDSTLQIDLLTGDR